MASCRLTSDFIALAPLILDFLDLDGFDLAMINAATDPQEQNIMVTSAMLHELANARSRSTRLKLETAQNSSKPESQGSTTSNSNRDNFVEKFRMNRKTYHDLLSTSDSVIRKPIRLGTSTEDEPNDAMLMALHYLGSRKTYKEIGEMFQVSETHAKASIHHTIDCLYNLVPTLITWPSSQADKAAILQSFESTCALPKVLGVLGTEHLQLSSNNSVSRFYTNVTGRPSIILQVVCDHQTRFRHCCTGWPGNMDAVSILHDSDIFQDISRDPISYFPGDSFLVGSQVYPLYHWLITPVMDDNHRELNHGELQFNFSHGLALETVSKAFFLLKKRFPRLGCLEGDNLENDVKTVLLSCALHNLCVDRDEQSFFEESGADDGDNNATLSASGSMLRIYHPDGIRRRTDLIQMCAGQVERLPNS